MTTPTTEIEHQACQPVPLNLNGFNPETQIPFGLNPQHIQAAMQEFLDFLGFVNTSLATKQIPRLEAFLMPANFSSMVGEFMNAAIPKYCKTLVKNNHHNGHPDGSMPFHVELDFPPDGQSGQPRAAKLRQTGTAASG